jgi:hypothetical protein
MFRDRIRQLIHSTIRAQCNGVQTAQDVNTSKATPNLGWRRREEPEDSTDYWKKFEEEQELVARTKQIHMCKPAACLVQDRGSARMRCKRKAPWNCSDEDYVLPNGDWGPKCGYGYVNAWNPVIANVMGCNHDVKILTNGQDSCKITFYCTCYAAKKQKRSHNISALLAKTTLSNIRKTWKQGACKTPIVSWSCDVLTG